MGGSGSKAITEPYLELDEFDDTYASLAMLNRTLILVRDEPFYWKWSIIAAHSALQGACICILTKTDGTGAFKKDGEEKLAEKLYSEKGCERSLDEPCMPWPQVETASLSKLLERLPSDLTVDFPERLIDPIPFTVGGDIKRLLDFRNDFTHFAPKSWSIEVGGLPRIIGAAIELTERISLSSNFSRHNKFCELRMSPLFKELNSSIRRLSAELTERTT